MKDRLRSEWNTVEFSKEFKQIISIWLHNIFEIEYSGSFGLDYHNV